MRHFKVISVMNYRERTIMLFGGPNELTKESFTVLEGFFFPCVCLIVFDDEIISRAASLLKTEN